MPKKKPQEHQGQLFKDRSWGGKRIPGKGKRLGRPVKENAVKPITKSFRLDPESVAMLCELSDRLGVTQTEVVRMALRDLAAAQEN